MNDRALDVFSSFRLTWLYEHVTGAEQSDHSLLIVEDPGFEYTSAFS